MPTMTLDYDANFLKQWSRRAGGEAPYAAPGTHGTTTATIILALTVTLPSAKTSTTIKYKNYLQRAGEDVFLFSYVVVGQTIPSLVSVPASKIEFVRVQWS